MKQCHSEKFLRDKFEWEYFLWRTLCSQHLLQSVILFLVLGFTVSPQMEWTFLSPSDSEPTVFPDQGSLSSHRQHGDGTYSLSSHLTVPPSLPPGTKITCTASHSALESPISVSLLLETPRQGLLYSLSFGVASVCEFPEPWLLSFPPRTDSYWWVFGFLVITALFFYQVMK